MISWHHKSCHYSLKIVGHATSDLQLMIEQAMGARGNNDWAKKFQKICPDGGDLQFAVWELQVAEWSLWGKRRVNFHTTCMIRARRIKFSRRTVDSAKFEIRDHAWKSSGISSRTRISNSWQKQHLNLPRLLSGNLPPVASRDVRIQLINSTRYRPIASGRMQAQS